ncbi:MAG: transglycosylase SLT domain-containing protein [Candidatus Izemoplasma sp.]
MSRLILNDSYDRDFKKYWDLWNPPVPLADSWLFLKAQCYAESAFKDTAVSPVGAKGLCQFMDPTWGQYGIGDPFNSEANINAAARYMSVLIDGWNSERPIEDKYKLAQASYNAGFGNLLKAQKKCSNNVLYDEIVPCLIKVTGRHSEETIMYVKRIWKGYYILLIG